MKIPVTDSSYIVHNLRSFEQFIGTFSKEVIDVCTVQRYGHDVVFRILGQALAAAGWTREDFVDHNFEIEDEPAADPIAHLQLEVGDSVVIFAHDEDGPYQIHKTIQSIFDTGFCVNSESFFFGGPARFYYTNGKFFSRTYLKMLEQEQKTPGMWNSTVLQHAEFAVPSKLHQD